MVKKEGKLRLPRAISATGTRHVNFLETCDCSPDCSTPTTSLAGLLLFRLFGLHTYDIRKSSIILSAVFGKKVIRKPRCVHQVHSSYQVQRKLPSHSQSLSSSTELGLDTGQIAITQPLAAGVPI
jgi:hypothetical protein